MDYIRDTGLSLVNQSQEILNRSSDNFYALIERAKMPHYSVISQIKTLLHPFVQMIQLCHNLSLLLRTTLAARYYTYIQKDDATAYNMNQASTNLIRASLIECLNITLSIASIITRLYFTICHFGYTSHQHQELDLSQTEETFHTTAFKIL